MAGTGGHDHQVPDFMVSQNLGPGVGALEIVGDKAEGVDEAPRQNQKLTGQRH